MSGGNVTNIVVRGLIPATKYQFTVQAYSEQGRSRFATPTVPVTTLGNPFALCSFLFVPLSCLVLLYLGKICIMPGGASNNGGESVGVVIVATSSNRN